jgi:hypothetical protein
MGAVNLPTTLWPDECALRAVRAWNKAQAAMVRDRRRLNLEDIAEMAGVSRSTVSRVLNEDPRVSDAVRARVRQVIKETRYHPNAAARSLATHRSNIIGLVFPRVFTMMFSDPWASVLIKGCIEGSERTDLSLIHMLVSTDDQVAVDRFFERSVMGRHLDGVILASHVVGDRLVERLQESDFPYVLVGRDAERRANFVDIDNRQATKGGYGTPASAWLPQCDAPEWSTRPGDGVGSPARVLRCDRRCRHGPRPGPGGMRLFRTGDSLRSCLPLPPAPQSP